jgi:hypothetical protein
MFFKLFVRYRKYKEKKDRIRQLENRIRNLIHKNNLLTSKLNEVQIREDLNRNQYKEYIKQLTFKSIIC